MCPHCRAFITTNDRVCPYCGEKVGPRAIDVRAAGDVLMGFVPARRFVTFIILFIDFALFGAGYLKGGDALFQAGAAQGVLIFVYHQWYRLITAGFLHGGLMHILMNSWVLFDLGAQVEEVYGGARLTVFFFLSTAAGFALSAWWHPSVPSVGASAGLFGLIGAMIALGVRTRDAMGSMIRGMYIRWAIYGLLFGLLPGFDNAAHIGGLAAGFAAAYLSGLPGRHGSPAEMFWRVAAGVAAALTALSFYQMYRQIAA